MKKLTLITILLVSVVTMAQETNENSDTSYKKRVLETPEVEFLSSYYTQDGDNASVTGGIGTEKLTDITPTIVITYPLNDDDVLTVDVGISAYTSASSSNVDPFDLSGASSGEDDDDDDDDDEGLRNNYANNVTGSPWVESSGASAGDVWANLSVTYSHSSDDRNKIWSAHASVSSEYDYFSIGFGGSYTHLFNEKNSEISISGQAYIDNWLPKYPTELDTYVEVDGNLNSGFFQGITIWDQNGNSTEGNELSTWSPVNGFELIKDKGRNTYSVSGSFSQIINKKAQFSIFFDLVKQDGWLANPMQRVYFGDRDNYYIGNPESIPNYTSSTNKNVFHLADDLERLPDSRFKIPIGARFNYYLNEVVSLRTYYRYYFDDWGLSAHTANIEIPIKISDKFTLYPSYRYYSQTAVDYFAPYEQNLSTQEFYTSDYDLSEFDAHQYGFGISYTDIFTKMNIWKLHLKSIDLRFNQYERSTGLKASIISGAFKFIIQ